MVKSGMEIKFLGNNTIYIKGKKETVLVNPEGSNNKVNSRIIIYNQQKYEVLGTGNDRVSIIGPGEYEVGGVEVTGLAAGDNNTMYTVLIDGVMVGILGKLTEEINEKKADKVNGVDVLVADVSNKTGIGAKALLKLAKTWGANYVIPVGYNSSNGDLATFLDESDNEGLEAMESLKVDKDSLPEGMEVVVLKETNG